MYPSPAAHLKMGVTLSRRERDCFAGASFSRREKVGHPEMVGPDEGYRCLFYFFFDFPAAASSIAACAAASRATGTRYGEQLTYVSPTR